MDTIVLKVGDFLDVARARGHTTYEQLSAATGLGVATLHRLRNGGPAGPAAIAKICQTYGVAFEDVFAFGTATPAQSPARRTRRQTRRPARDVKAAAA
ncbi:helix-turn-helix domain-containing protein [Streptomyces sp. NPDC006527]|jgi:transcriptional regulator with XRE-family HTH domain|uniref:helix-turn-helix domain-containing protein n=1 Tax=Streptomyces sp. NPDC006527 TaxID=3364749 RepID=UPI0036A0A1DC